MHACDRHTPIQCIHTCHCRTCSGRQGTAATTLAVGGCRHGGCRPAGLPAPTAQVECEVARTMKPQVLRWRSVIWEEKGVGGTNNRRPTCGGGRRESRASLVTAWMILLAGRGCDHTRADGKDVLTRQGKGEPATTRCCRCRGRAVWRAWVVCCRTFG